MCHCHLTAALGVHVSQGHGKWPVRVNLSICPPFDSLSCQHSWEHLSAPRHPSGVSLPLHGVARPELQRSCRHSGASIRSPVILTRLNQWEADNLHVTKTEDLMLLFGSNCIYIYIFVSAHPSRGQLRANCMPLSLSGYCAMVSLLPLGQLRCPGLGGTAPRPRRTTPFWHLGDMICRDKGRSSVLSPGLLQMERSLLSTSSKTKKNLYLSIYICACAF